MTLKKREARKQVPDNNFVTCFDVWYPALGARSNSSIEIVQRFETKSENDH